MLPPMEQMSHDDGSGGYQSPCSAAAAFTAELSAPGSTNATWTSGSTSTAVIRSRLSTMPPSRALAPPESPVPAPRGTTGTPCSAAQRTAVCTWVASCARTTASGVPACGSCERSQRYFSVRSTSDTTTSSGSDAIRPASASVRASAGSADMGAMQPRRTTGAAGSAAGERGFLVGVGDVAELAPHQREGQPGPDEGDHGAVTPDWWAI